MDEQKEYEQNKFLSDIKDAIVHLEKVGNVNGAYTLKAIMDSIDTSHNRQIDIMAWMNQVTNAKFKEICSRSPDEVLSWVDGKYYTFRGLVKEGAKIHCIKIIRMYTGYGLTETKSFIDANWERWKKMVSDDEEGSLTT